MAVRVFDVPGRVRLRDVTRPGVRYQLNLTSRTCTCDGYTAHLICKHICLALIQTGLVAPTPQPCPDCNGRRGEKISTGGYFSDWIWRTCSTCKGEGVI